jgi:aspartyl-tRNA(Asn)/glutamyl-tRNA(Gln) amidotransferase subunit A
VTELHYLPATELAQLVSQRKVSSVEITQAYLERIGRLDDALRAFITVDPDGALAQARAADSATVSGGLHGALHGVPVAIKDNIATAGIRTTAGSRVLANWVPEEDAPVVRDLKRAGAVIVGKTNLHEFAYGGTCTNVEFGAVRNPWNTAHVPGGSSGGSGVAVAAGLCAAALGTDTAGSVRLPASQCGVVGLKPTYGRTSLAGVTPLAWSLDHVGPLSRTVADAALVYRVLSGTPPPSMIDAGIAGLRLGVPRTFFFDSLQSDVAAAVERALDSLREMGATLVDVAWPDVDRSNSITWTIILGEASAYHRSWLQTRPEAYSEETRQNLRIGERLTAAEYVQAQRARSVVQRRAAEVMTGVDALVTPSLQITAPRIGQASVELGGKVKDINPVFIRLSDPFNVTGQPAISVPCGFGDNGLPIGLQIAGRPFDEEMVLRVASAFESATPWHLQRPALAETARR